MASEENEAKCFTFLWKLENISYCLQKRNQLIKSPAFVVDAINETRWRLWIYPRGYQEGNYMSVFLYREEDSKGAIEEEVKYELAFIAKDGSSLVSWKKDKYAFSRGDNFGLSMFHKQKDVFNSRRSVFIPQDTLTARCRIWKSDGEMEEEVQYTAHTRIGVEKRSFLWNLKNFSTLESENKCTYQIKSVENGTPLIIIDLSFAEGLSSGEILRFELALHNQIIKFCTLQLSLIDAFGNRVGCNQDEFWLDSLDEIKHFTKERLLANKHIYLPNDVLSLHWEWEFSKGVVFEETGEVQCGSSISSIKMSDNQIDDNVNKFPFSDTLNNNLKSLYDKQVLCDVKLKTKTGTFPAHKIILVAASSVFNAMFTNDMKEKNSDVVYIEDLNDDAVSGMLFYMYTERVEDLSWESATHLYVAADKYDILNLKIICSSYLKDNLTPRSACEALLLSDIHADGNLKSAVQDYILKHIVKIVNLDEWKLLMETNGKLAAETVCLQYK